jgi:hypothetical protein
MYVISLLLGVIPAACALRKPRITHFLLFNNQPCNLRRLSVCRLRVRRLGVCTLGHFTNSFKNGRSLRSSDLDRHPPTTASRVPVTNPFRGLEALCPSCHLLPAGLGRFRAD